MVIAVADLWPVLARYIESAVKRFRAGTARPRPQPFFYLAEDPDWSVPGERGGLGDGGLGGELPRNLFWVLEGSLAGFLGVRF